MGGWASRAGAAPPPQLTGTRSSQRLRLQAQAGCPRWERPVTVPAGLAVAQARPQGPSGLAARADQLAQAGRN